MEEAHRACLIGDLRTLAQEARRPESLAGQLTGWISGPEHPMVKDAAEKVLQSLEDDSWAETLADSEVLMTCCESQSVCWHKQYFSKLQDVFVAIVNLELSLAFCH